MSLKIHKKTFNELSTKELYEIIKLRINVFIVEQAVSYQDLDDYDQRSVHYFIKDFNDEIVSYIRVFPKNVKYDEASIGRVVTNDAYRNQGLAKQLMIEAINDLEKMGMREIKISAQLYLKSFYESLGFEVVSNVYLEDQIEHIEMLKK